MSDKRMKIIIMCGGQGTRLREETEFIPKPLVEIGGWPILWHIMNTYSFFGYKNFILCLGYKGAKIKEYFLNYELLNSDFTVELGKEGENKTVHNAHREVGWKITMADTGELAMTGARLKKVEKYIDDKTFMVTYGDGVANIDIDRLVRFHKEHGRIATVTGVRPPSRFGQLLIEGSFVKEFSEKPQLGEGHINGGFFVFNREVFDYLSDSDECILERDPLERIALDGELMMYEHNGYWQCMDTLRDCRLLNELWKAEKAPWKVWRD